MTELTELQIQTAAFKGTMGAFFVVFLIVAGVWRMQVGETYFGFAAFLFGMFLMIAGMLV